MGNFRKSMSDGAMTEDECEDVGEGMLFYVNHDGLPIGHQVWSRMWAFAARKHPDGQSLVARCRDANVPNVPIPLPPSNNQEGTMAEKLACIQKYMETLQYNHTGTQFFEIRKNRPLIGHMETAREMVREALPIKCLEAVILGLFLTAGLPGLERFTLSFKSQFNETSVHRHVVLGTYFNGRYGALGLSRRATLSYKPLHYESLISLVLDFEAAYKDVGHKLIRVSIGTPVSHDLRSFETIHWRLLVLTGFWKRNKEEIRSEVERCAKEMRTKMRTTNSTQGQPPMLLRRHNSMSPQRRSLSLRQSHSFTAHSTQATSSDSSPETS